MKQYKGFTLVQVIIAFAIIAILIGIVFPILSYIRERGRQIVCMSNLRQIGLALHFYAQDWLGFVPPYHNSRGAFDTGGIRTRFGLLRIDPRLYDPKLAVAVFDRYVKNKEIWFCPCDYWRGKDYPLNPNPKESDPLGPMDCPRNRIFTSYCIRSENALFAPVSIYYQPRFSEAYFPPEKHLSGALVIPSADNYWVRETWYAQCNNHYDHDMIHGTTIEYEHEHGKGKLTLKWRLIFKIKFDGRVIRGRVANLYGTGVAPLD